jgi:cobalt/nickel transport protein
MKSQLKGFLWVGLGVSLLLAIFISPFASPSPDGLEKVAEERGLLEKGDGWTLWRHAPLPDYLIPGIKNEKLATALAGLIGTVGIFMIAIGLAKVLKKTKRC